MQFTVLDEDKKKIQKFREEQNEIAKRKKLKYEYGGDITYCFTTSGIGEIFYVVHNATKAKLDLTNVGTW